jgi:hypothetical protein
VTVHHAALWIAGGSGGYLLQGMHGAAVGFFITACISLLITASGRGGSSK